MVYPIFKQPPFGNELKKLIRNKTFTKKAFESIEFTELLRAAYVNSHIRKYVKKFYGFSPLPIDNKFTLYPHQVRCINFIIERERCSSFKGGIIRMDMGLGKTLTAVSLSLITHRKGETPTLAVVSKSLLLEWKSDIEKFFGKRINALFVHKDCMDVQTLDRTVLNNYDIVVTTYDVISSVYKSRGYKKYVEVRWNDPGINYGKVMKIRSRKLEQLDNPNAKGPAIIYNFPWKRIFCDESQRFANPSTFSFKSVMALYGERKWCLTGTPIKNYTSDIWAQLRFCGYDGTEFVKDWNQNYSTYIKTHNIMNSIFSLNYEDANIKLPDLIQHKINIKMNDDEQTIYSSLKKNAIRLYEQMMNREEKYACVLAMFTRMRQICISPKLIDKNNTCESTKIKRVPKLVENIPNDEKVVVFSNFSSALSLVAETLKCDYVYVDGQTKNRRIAFDKFRNDSGKKVLLMTYKIGSEGLNLSEANHVICLDPWWNSTVIKQAIARVHRIGQTKKVHVYTLITENTIECDMVRMCEDKMKMTNRILYSKRMKNIKLDKQRMALILGL